MDIASQAAQHPTTSNMGDAFNSLSLEGKESNVYRTGEKHPMQRVCNMSRGLCGRRRREVNVLLHGSSSCTCFLGDKSYHTLGMLFRQLCLLGTHRVKGENSSAGSRVNYLRVVPRPGVL